MLHHSNIVADYMTRDLTAVSVETTLREVIEILSSERIYGVPVIDDDNKVIGFISEKTVVRSVFPERILLAQPFLIPV